MKIAPNPKGRQAGGLALIHYDLEFAAKAFETAAAVSEADDGVSPPPNLGGPELAMKVIQSLDSVLRKGGMIGLFDANRQPIQSIWISSLFEAAVSRYARCFNSGQRTVLSKSSFAGSTARYRELHDEIMEARNSHVAHAGMEHEDCLVGFHNVLDRKYGARPSTQFAIMVMRTPTPDSARLRELSKHCAGIDAEIVIPKIERCMKSLREDVLRMKQPEIDSLEDFMNYQTKLKKVLARPTPSPTSPPP